MIEIREQHISHKCTSKSNFWFWGRKNRPQNQGSFMTIESSRKRAFYRL